MIQLMDKYMMITTHYTKPFLNARGNQVVKDAAIKAIQTLYEETISKKKWKRNQ